MPQPRIPAVHTWMSAPSSCARVGLLYADRVVWGTQLRVAPSQSKHKLYVGNIPKELTRDTLKEQISAVAKGESFLHGVPCCHSHNVSMLDGMCCLGWCAVSVREHPALLNNGLLWLLMECPWPLGAYSSMCLVLGLF